jgi:hypothetical protein
LEPWRRGVPIGTMRAGERRLQKMILLPMFLPSLPRIDFLKFFHCNATMRLGFCFLLD